MTAPRRLPEKSHCPPMPTTAQRRTHYDDFVQQVINLCKVNGIRADLVSGRGRPLEDCPRMPEHLTRHILGFGAQRAHYTVASLIAMQRDLPHEDSPYQPELPTTPARAASIGPYTHPRPAATAGAPRLSEPAGNQPTPVAWRARPDLGTSLAIAVARHGLDEAHITRRFKTLTKLGAPLLHPEMWRLTSRLHNRDAARLDFAVLLEDLAWWDHHHKDIAARWRTSYFTTLHTLTEQDPA
ncbi:type I-E CRISPR-associated protein Cse2/CasB [Streptomyces sp. NPDC090088]|uniref:type I-E CRISPR-associated protein Cse2/CasB n=1 Tax=Streptomyces sp. NPDC090088 TaxID=3365944 RepID=UPI00382C98BC